MRLAAVALFLLLPLVSGAAPLRVAREGAKIRATAGFDGPVLAEPPISTSLELLETQNEWRRVRLADGTEGYIHELFVEEAPAAQVAAPAQAAAPVEAPPLSPPAAAPIVPSQPVPVDTRSVEVGQLKARVAALEFELQATKGRVATAERAAMEASDALERERDEHAKAERELRSECEDRIAQAQKSIDDAKAGVSDLAALQAEKQQLEDSLATAATEKEEAVARCEAEHRELYDTYVEIVTKRHEEALARDREAGEAACRDHLAELERKYQHLLASARKESGWEADFEQELRERTELAVNEARARWEAKQRGDQYDEERVRREEGARVREACETERLAAISTALEAQRVEVESRVARERDESDARCQVALEIVLERAAAGEDVSDMREAAKRSRERLDAAHAPAPGPPPAPAPTAAPAPVP
jgi:hypothetical protein